MKRALMILFFGIMILGSISSVSAIQGVCTGTQTCFCSGKAVSCPCDANPCVICGSASPECVGQGKSTTRNNVQEVNIQNNQNTGGEINTQNPQTFEDYVAVFGKGLGILMEDLWHGAQNVGKIVSSPFRKKNSGNGLVYDIKGKVWRNSSGSQGDIYDVKGKVWRNSSGKSPLSA
jgi:hypothetical protein